MDHSKDSENMIAEIVPLLNTLQEARIVRRMFVASTSTLEHATRALEQLRKSIEDEAALVDRPTPT